MNITPIEGTPMRISFKVSFVCFLILLNLFSLQKLYADRVFGSQQLVEDLYGDLVITSMKELSTDEQEKKLKKLFLIGKAIIANWGWGYFFYIAKLEFKKQKFS